MNEQAVFDLVQKAKVVLFDYSDTLVKTMKSQWAQHKYIARKFYEKKLTDEELRSHWGKPFSALLSCLYETNHIDIAMSYYLATRERFPKAIFKDVLTTLEFFREAKKKLGLITATSLSNLNDECKMCGIPKCYFDYIQTEDDTIFHKPDPRVFAPTLKWLAKQEIQPSEVVYVGDHWIDLSAATNAGLPFIAVTTGMISGEEFAQRQTPYVSCLSELCVSYINTTSVTEEV